jgi:hypothetical protein
MGECMESKKKIDKKTMEYLLEYTLMAKRNSGIFKTKNIRMNG